MSNDQIHNNLCLTVENSIEIGKVYQVTEKWVFFKLLFQILQTDSSGGKNHIPQVKFNFEQCSWFRFSIILFLVDMENVSHKYLYEFKILN